MADAFYIAPFGLIYPVGGGRWSAASSGAVRGPSLGSRCMIYGPGWASDAGYQCTAFAPVGGSGQGKSWCVTLVTVPDADTATLDALDSDPNILRIPFGRADVLGRTFGDLPGAVQTAIVNAFEARRIPADWITPTTTLRQLLAFVLRLLLCAQALGTSFPELDLTATLRSITLARRNAIRNWLAANGATSADLVNSSTIRQVLTRLVQVRTPIRLRDLEF